MLIVEVGIGALGSSGWVGVHESNGTLVLLYLARGGMIWVAFRFRWSIQGGDGGLDSRLRGNDGSETAKRPRLERY